jgi:hypothetical protein
MNKFGANLCKLGCGIMSLCFIIPVFLVFVALCAGIISLVTGGKL